MESKHAVAQGQWNSLALKALEVSLLCMAQGPAGTLVSLPLRSPGLIEPPRTEDLFCPFFLMSIHGQSKREAEKLTIS